MFIGLGLLSGLAVSAMAGWWAILAAVLASILGESASRIVHLVRSTKESEVSEVPSSELSGTRPFQSLLFATDILMKAALVSLAAWPLGLYVFPQHAVLASVLLIILLFAAVSLGLRLSPGFRLWINGLLVAAAIAFIVTCLAVPPVAHSSVPNEKGLPGVMVSTVVSAAVFFPFFFVSSQISSTQASRLFSFGANLRRNGAALFRTVLAAGVLAVSLYQRDFINLGLSSTPLRDVLIAADATVLEPWLRGVVVIVASSVTVMMLSPAKTESKSRSSRQLLGGESTKIGIAALGFLLLASYTDFAILLWLAVITAIGKCLVAAALLSKRTRYRP